MYLHQHWIPLKVPVLHQYFGLAMLASGLVYIVSGIVNGQLRSLLFNGDDVAGLWPMAEIFGNELLALFGGHMVMVATTGLRRNVRAIVTGIRDPLEAYAVEHERVERNGDRRYAHE